MASQVERAWAAGFFDGEGCTCVRRPDACRRYAHMSINHTSRELLEKFQNAVGGLGSITGPYDRTSRRVDDEMYGLRLVRQSPIYTWSAGRVAQIRETLGTLAPYLGQEKMAQAEIALGADTR